MNMARREDVLEETLERIGKGTSLEEAAAAHPELAPLLYVARLLEETRPPAPSLRAELASQTAFLRRAAELRASRRPWIWRLSGWLRYAPAGGLIAALLLIAGTLHAMAQSSLPGDPLYGLKRMEEQIWLALTLDPVEQRLVEEALAARRWAEYRALAQRRGAGTVTWEGRIESIEGSTWRIGGIPVAILPGTEIIGPVAPGQPARVAAFLGPGGQLVAARIQAAPETPTPAPTETPPPSPTRVPRATPAPSPSAPPAPMETPPPATATVAPTPTGTPIPSPEKTREPPETPRPTRMPEEEDEEEVQWDGVLQAISGSVWVIGGRTVQVPGETEIRGDPGIGDWVEVRARRQPDGTLVAVRIRREESPEGRNGRRADPSHWTWRRIERYP